MGRKPPSGRQSGQRAISSFLFKPQPQPAQPSGDSRTAPEPTPSRSPATASPGGPPPAEASGPPAKRARFFPPPSAENGDAHVAGNPSTAVPQPAKLAAGPKQAPTKDNHQRFQNKLVHGIGNRKHGDSNTIVPQKHTPLELQVVDLKQKHPGVLLAVEVRSPSSLFSGSRAKQQTAAPPSRVACSALTMTAGRIQVQILWRRRRDSLKGIMPSSEQELGRPCCHRSFNISPRLEH